MENTSARLDTHRYLGVAVPLAISLSPKFRGSLQIELRPANPLIAPEVFSAAHRNHANTSSAKCLKLKGVMPEQSKSHSWAFMFAVFVIFLAAASAIAYGIISQYFHR